MKVLKAVTEDKLELQAVPRVLAEKRKVAEQKSAENEMLQKSFHEQWAAPRPRVWIPDTTHGFLPVEVLLERGTQLAIVDIKSKAFYNPDHSKLVPRLAVLADGNTSSSLHKVKLSTVTQLYEDLSNMRDVYIGCFLHQLRQRFAAGMPYTRIGPSTLFL